ncbi:MAG: hypothetical protein IJ301_01260 [Clostridia bacterium]|nr:hypothetical protein [Clostridia bacterium]
MIVSSANRRAKCSGNTMCTNRVCFNLRFSKSSIYLCEKCARELYESLGKNLVPRSIKNKFNFEK